MTAGPDAPRGAAAHDARERIPAEGELTVLTEGRPDDPAYDMALSHAALREVAEGRRGPLLRMFRPGPTVAFGRLDSLRPGYADAVAAARRHGMTPVLRMAGGQAAAYDEGSLVVEHVVVTRDPASGLHERFADGTTLLADALRTLGLDARIGPLEGEYCPGEFSINIDGRVKVAGMAQRALRGAALLGAVVVVGSGRRVRDTIRDVYAALDRPVDPATAGSIDELAPAVDIAAVRAAILAAFADRAQLRHAQLDAALHARAETLVAPHRVA